MAVQKIQKTQTTTLGIQTGKFSYIVNGSYDKEAFVNLKIPKEFLELRKLEDFKEPFRFFKTSTFVIKLTMAEDKLRHKASKMFKPNESDIIDIDTENT